MLSVTILRVHTGFTRGWHPDLNMVTGPSPSECLPQRPSSIRVPEELAFTFPAPCLSCLSLDLFPVGTGRASETQRGPGSTPHLHAHCGSSWVLVSGTAFQRYAACTCWELQSSLTPSPQPLLNRPLRAHCLVTSSWQGRGSSV